MKRREFLSKTVSFDIAKSVFQVHGVDATGQVVIRRKWKRPYVLIFFEKLPPCQSNSPRDSRAKALDLSQMHVSNLVDPLLCGVMRRMGAPRCIV